MRDRVGTIYTYVVCNEYFQSLYFSLAHPSLCTYQDGAPGAARRVLFAGRSMGCWSACLYDAFGLQTLSS
jgi:hypothetical protein